MYSIAFPNFLDNTSTKVIQGEEASASNLILTLMSMKNELFGDPYFGTNIKRLMFEQNNYVLRDIIIDDLYTAIITFMPQISLKRDNITLRTEKNTVYVDIKALNLLDYTVNTYSISLTDDGEI